MNNADRDLQYFDGMANSYDNHRVRYPRSVFAWIDEFWGMKDPPVIADIGCGTGISTRGIYDYFEGRCAVTGVEPGEDMLRQARAASAPSMSFIEGRAEALPMANLSTDIVTAALAAQWFNRPAFYREAIRIMRPGAIIAIFENNRHWKNNKFLDEHEQFLEEFSIDPNSGSRYSRWYRNNPYKEELLAEFGNSLEKEISWTTIMTVAEFYAMARTSTQFKRAEANIGVVEAREKLLDYTSNHQIDGELHIDFLTRAHFAKKTAEL